ncbi:hypothetical protein CO057_01430 [Candidatus Uhrbacteria bacterium CG_4_9_14_0_2_um_filter_41_50]|uniref:Uncharacterized protein n=1 Tax=Candidatus Uhrbacteria bacterium CG_4_9_14_0_2_um_filter_41_50 TaxID=1975031 RepID=A0A2M8EPP6_9BACT|nr:MAG: hypothetical protein COZ45_03810 [Candidatus Uhrbacteria bacterium CG_4_10_14_3_um_filter_41_21]PIZ54725.1 MAG: hypothetical protein COY24_02735 [Candidatus Uhrbacteria bacterium CG_4_10_14_0_2_um_filter_41_21]PJB85098.1 MAG: hypothetical protein CO086_00080 [Candidatus Uhrbacteria bacterium CG_4_9_14_0_8_um_filter_41_16]PJC24706.1 MAG: hypothetical protein CO057_01430 [Candidatus Uhrbacteria bacterium CG_4_9_14_0_2_um_filter_41_50]PJE75448.1 MAG: hypothetical protein COV03_00080 [Candi
MQTEDKLPLWQLIFIIYGGIGIFTGPLLQLFVYGDHWMLFTILKVVITVAAFFCLIHSIAYALGNYWIAGVLSLTFLGIFFWRPVGYFDYWSTANFWGIDCHGTNRYFYFANQLRY